MSGITSNGRRKLIRAVEKLEDCAAEGNTWGPETDADILAGIVLDNLTPALTKRETRDLVEALDYAREDLQYRLDQGKDYEARDGRNIKAKLARWAALEEKLGKA